MSMDDCTGETLNLSPEDVVEVECREMIVSGTIRSPTITEIVDRLANHSNDHTQHWSSQVFELVTDGVSTFYSITHNLATRNVTATFFDITRASQQLLFVHWEPVSDNEIRIVPDIILPANRKIRVLIQQ